MPGPNGELYVVELGHHNENLMLNEFKGNISLIVCTQGQDGRNYFRMAYPKNKHGQQETAIPIGVKLGNKDQAIRILTQFITVLRGQGGQK
jgi:hypothetical protein